MRLIERNRLPHQASAENRSRDEKGSRNSCCPFRCLRALPAPTQAALILAGHPSDSAPAGPLFASRHLVRLRFSMRQCLFIYLLHPPRRASRFSVATEGTRVGTRSRPRVGEDGSEGTRPKRRMGRMRDDLDRYAVLLDGAAPPLKKGEPRFRTRLDIPRLAVLAPPRDGCPASR